SECVGVEDQHCPRRVRRRLKGKRSVRSRRGSSAGGPSRRRGSTCCPPTNFTARPVAGCSRVDKSAGGQSKCVAQPASMQSKKPLGRDTASDVSSTVE